MEIKGYLTIYDEGVTEATNLGIKKKKKKPYVYYARKKPIAKPIIIPDGFIKIPNFSHYFINDKGIIISIRTSKMKFLKPRKSSINYHYVGIRDDNDIQVKIPIEKTVKELFNNS
jgi:hypothetical protein